MRTLLISLGGGRYPSAPDLAHKAFSLSSCALGNLLIKAEGGIVSANDWLDLFDDDQSWPDQLIRARNWLRERTTTKTPPNNVIVHYVGHGWFKPNSEDHLLTINHTDQEEKAATSATLSSLNAMLRREAGKTRRYYLIDACFAAASVKDLMADHREAIERQVGQIIRAWPEEGGRHGVAALCSADKSSVASARGRDLLTQFTDGLIAVLKQGDPASGDRLPLRRSYELLRGVLYATYGEEMVHPVLVAPNDAGGGIAGVPVFANAAWKGRMAVATVATDVSPVQGPAHPDLSDRSLDTFGVAEPETVGLTEPGDMLSLSATPALGDNAQLELDAVQDLDATLNKDPNFRTTMYRFFRLAPSQKDEIVGKLGLEQPEDSSRTELERFKAALRRARVNGKTGSLEGLIDKAEAGE